MKKIEELYIKYIPSGWVGLLIAAYMFTSASLWIIEDYLDMDHEPHWYDMVHLMAFIAAGVLIYFVGELVNKRWSVKSYKSMDDMIIKEAHYLRDRGPIIIIRDKDGNDA